MQDTSCTRLHEPREQCLCVLVSFAWRAAIVELKAYRGRGGGCERTVERGNEFMQRCEGLGRVMERERDDDLRARKEVEEEEEPCPVRGNLTFVPAIDS